MYPDNSLLLAVVFGSMSTCLALLAHPSSPSDPDQFPNNKSGFLAIVLPKADDFANTLVSADQWPYRLRWCWTTTISAVDVPMANTAKIDADDSFAIARFRYRAFTELVWLSIVTLEHGKVICHVCRSHFLFSIQIQLDGSWGRLDRFGLHD